MFPRRRGRPPKPPSPHAFDWRKYTVVTNRVAADYVGGLRTRFDRPNWVWDDLRQTLAQVALDELQKGQLARRWNGVGSPAGYLRRYLLKRCAAQFAEEYKTALAQTWDAASDHRVDDDPASDPAAPAEQPEPLFDYLEFTAAGYAKAYPTLRRHLVGAVQVGDRILAAVSLDPEADEDVAEAFMHTA